MVDHPTDFVTLARTAESWNTDPGRVLSWLALGNADLDNLSTPAREEVGRRLADLRTVADSLRAHGFLPSWTHCTQNPVPGTGGRTMAEHVKEGTTAQVIEAIQASADGVFA
jgi:hypothetical protein